MIKYFKGQILCGRENPAETAEIIEYYPETKRYLIKHSQENKPKERASGGIGYGYYEDGTISDANQVIFLESEEEIDKKWEAIKVKNKEVIGGNYNVENR